MDIKVVRRKPEKRQLTLADVPDGWAFRFAHDTAGYWRIRLRMVGGHMIEVFNLCTHRTCERVSTLSVAEFGKLEATVTIEKDE